MKKLNIVFYLLLVAVLSSCNRTPQELVNSFTETVTIDGCEYIVMKTSQRGFMAHKGNCINH